MQKIMFAFLVLALGGPAAVGAQEVRVRAIVTWADGAQRSMAWWRVGLNQARVESGPVGGPADQLVVYDEPQVWLADLKAGTGQTFRDPGPNLGFHASAVRLYDSRSWNQVLLGLEVGDEAAFFQKAGRSTVTDPDTGLAATLTLGASGQPRRLVLAQEGRTVLTLDYTEYSQGPVTPGRYGPPPGIDLRASAP